MTQNVNKLTTSTQRNIRFTGDNWSKLLKICDITNTNINRTINNLIAQRYQILTTEPTVKKAMAKVDNAIDALNDAICKLEKGKEK